MTMLTFNPMKTMEELSRRAGSLINDFEKGVNFDYGKYSPRVDITEDEKNVYIYADAPGMSKEEIRIFIDEENNLHIKGDKKKEKKNENQVFLRTERVFGSFERIISLHDTLLKENISAKYDNGVLEISLPKVEPPLPKEIEIEIK
jgi:HSP20 family protein